MTPASIPVQTIARFAHEGRVFRSFGRFLAARDGSLLAVPVGLATGDFSAVRDGSPVPWGEVLAAIDTPVSTLFEALQPEQLARLAPLLAALFPPYGWAHDHIAVSAGGRPVARVSSPDGVIFCWVPQD
ncbi:MAG TPA: hypothetical protein PK225_02550 [Azonexus sp.]|nr:hypothetical protein [Azonexus sp.]